MEKIWLASKSPRRAELLTRLGLEYEILTAEVDETVDGEPSACVETLAKRKADAGAEKAGAGWVLAADTLVDWIKNDMDSATRTANTPKK